MLPPPFRERAQETELLVAYFRSVPDGTFSSFAQLSDLIGMDTADCKGKGRRRIYAAIRILARENINLEGRKGGIYRLTTPEYFQTTTKTLRRTRNAARQALLKTELGLNLDVPDESRLRLASERVVLAMHVQLSKERNTTRIMHNLERDTERHAWDLKIDLSKILR
jgi:hypothetical protein